MQTEILKIGQQETTNRVCELLADHQVIAAPTDTVYGLFTRFDSPTAIERIYLAKQRPADKAIPVLISKFEQLCQLATMPLPDITHRLIEKFWPGPLTLILNAVETLPTILTANQPTIAVRMPNHAALCELLDVAGPLAATSANISDGPETHSAIEVMAQLSGRIPLILEDPISHDQPTSQLASTIVDLSKANISKIVRTGPIADRVQKVLEG